MSWLKTCQICFHTFVIFLSIYLLFLQIKNDIRLTYLRQVSEFSIFTLACLLVLPMLDVLHTHHTPHTCTHTFAHPLLWTSCRNIARVLELILEFKNIPELPGLAYLFPSPN